NDFLEVQLLDDDGPRFRQLAANLKTGAIYKVSAANPPIKKPAGEWHRVHIRVEGPRVVVKFDGVPVNYINAEHHRKLLGSFLEKKQGRVALQIMAGVVEFKNIRLRELKKDPPGGAVDPNPFNRLRRASIPPDKRNAPKEIVAILGDSQREKQGILSMALHP